MAPRYNSILIKMKLFFNFSSYKILSKKNQQQEFRAVKEWIINHLNIYIIMTKQNSTHINSLYL